MFDSIESQANDDGSTSAFLVHGDDISMGFSFGVSDFDHKAILVSITAYPDGQFHRCDTNGYCYGRNFNSSSVRNA